MIEILGYKAGFLTTFSASPQLIYSYRSGDVASLDLKFLLMLLSGLVLWGIYGIVIGSLPVVFFNFFGSLLWLPIIFMKLKASSLIQRWSCNPALINTTGLFLIQAIKHLFKKRLVMQPIQILKPVPFVLTCLVHYSSQ